jgi:hypothetical protein
MTQAQKPEYIGLLNTIRQGEADAGIILKAWADKTSSPALRHCLNLVTEREISHGDIFDRRIRELGYDIEEVRESRFAERLEVLGSDAPDAEKIEYIKTAFDGPENEPSVRDRYVAAMEDEGVDHMTRLMIRWYHEVELDSGKLMGEAYTQL